MKNKKIIIGIIIAIILIIAIITGVIIYISNQEKPEDVFNTYISYINEKNYVVRISMNDSEYNKNIFKQIKEFINGNF